MVGYSGLLGRKRRGGGSLFAWGKGVGESSEGPPVRGFSRQEGVGECGECGEGVFLSRFGKRGEVRRGEVRWACALGPCAV